MASPSFCYACLTSNDETRVGCYVVQNETLRTIFKMSELQLCYVCKRIAQRTDMFLLNVQCNQIWLEHFQNITPNTLQTETQIQPIIHLSYKQLSPTTVGYEDTYTGPKEFVSLNVAQVTVKKEFKEESDGEILDYDCAAAIQALEPLVKEENEYIQVKIERVQMKKRGRKRKRLTELKKPKVKVENKRVKKRESNIETIHLSMEQYQLEKEKRSQDIDYTEKVYKCEKCVKAFVFKGTYDKHMERHSKSNGPHICEYCEQRFDTKLKLSYHLKNHTLRYRCSVCGYTKANRPTVKDHFTSQHRGDLTPQLFNCPECPKKFKRHISLRRHKIHSHMPKSRVQCDYCKRTYACKDILKSHMIMKHPNEVSGGKLFKRYVCEECGKPFSARSLLHTHMRSHSLRKDYYCVECDKSFKSESILKHHLKTASPHCKYAELPLICVECDKRFAIKRDLERHMNRVHLNVKPHQCDQCERAYINSYSLKEHHRLAHEGYKRPLKFPCSMCDRVFDRNQILKSHLRTHTGERPYQCTECDATFSQSSALGTHFKLIHLKLTRDGRPKNVSILRQ